MLCAGLSNMTVDPKDQSLNVINPPKSNAPSAESKDSASPLLNPRQDPAPDSSASDPTTKPRKRDFWKFNKKDEDKQAKASKPAAVPVPLSSPFRATDTLGGSISPHRIPSSTYPGSPGQNLHSQNSRPQSPASSMIFERNVQEDVALPEVSPHLPSHVIIENHIAPALDASAEAITNEKLDPDTVEIVTHATHQPASVTITRVPPEPSLGSPVLDDLTPAPRQDTEETSNYGSLDQTDVRRLSFISFADVVHGEQENLEGRRDSAHLSGHHGFISPRSPSPIRSPTSSAAFGTSPPTSVTASVKGFETSPHRHQRGTASPLPGQSSPLAAGSEINIETMRQALRKTGSGDLSHFRSAPASAVGNDDGTYDRSFR
ncbi:hypothetical protein B0A52_01167 [Exophiala mesophila]|uniref:Uncharacterized protein n=1 Tax=Exophiala mesophila TaxID=212818 RepID=A0A438NGN4_EXOME|nr:hypothetical protein B0A52_01167 [Exophiala mesophila]